jgi:hypothetical protein
MKNYEKLIEGINEQIRCMEACNDHSLRWVDEIQELYIQLADLEEEYRAEQGVEDDEDDYFDYGEAICDPYKAMDEVMLAMQKATCECGSTEQKVDYVEMHNQMWFVRSCASCNKEVYRYLD